MSDPAHLAAKPASKRKINSEEGLKRKGKCDVPFTALACESRRTVLTDWLTISAQVAG